MFSPDVIFGRAACEPILAAATWSDQDLFDWQRLDEATVQAVYQQFKAAFTLD